MRIGPLSLPEPVVAMAPMAGVTDLPCRLVARRYGCSLAYSELVSARALCQGSTRSFERICSRQGDRPLGIQIFGSEPAVMARAAALVAELAAPDLIDINMGCPAPKITRNDEGCALMLDPARAGEVARAVVEAVRVPVTVKLRKGWDDQHVTAPAVARELERAGVAALAVHGRTRCQFYTGKADWDAIRRVKEAVAIPVLGNGDVDDPRAAARLLEATGCDGVMIGRASLGNPWLFARCRRYLASGELLPEPTARERIEQAVAHARLAWELRGSRGLIELRKHLAWYLKGVPHASRVKGELQRAASPGDVEKALGRLLEALGARAGEGPHRPAPAPPAFPSAAAPGPGAA